MRTVHIHEAKTHLSRLVDAASKGEPFLICLLYTSDAADD